MREIRIMRLVPALVVLLSASVLAGCGGIDLNSTWRDRDVDIDGVPAEWQGTTTYVENPNIAIGVMNDAECLYISLSSPVSDVANQIVLRGLTVWFDPEGGKQRAFGIHCPIGVQVRPDDNSQMTGRNKDRRAFQEMVLENVEGSAENLEILGPYEDDRIMLSSAEAHGIEVAVGHKDGRFVYELKVPLQADEMRPYAIGAEKDRPIGIGVETPQIDMEALREGMGGGMPEGGMPGGGGRGGGMRPGGGRGGSWGPGQIPKRLQIWGKIQLASHEE
jgi:hypothetical protein